MAARLGLEGEETIIRAGKGLRLTDKQPALNALQSYHHPQSPGWPLPAVTHTCICSFVTAFLGEAVPGEGVHSLTSESIRAGAGEVWVQATAPCPTGCLCRLPI